MALDDLGNVYAQGFNNFGQLGNGTTGYQQELLPIKVDTLPNGIKFKDISAGFALSVILSTTGQVYTFGTNDNGCLGNNSLVAFSAVPVPVDTSGVLSGKRITKVSAGFRVGAVLDETGTAYTWGYNPEGSLGDGTFVDSPVPVQVLTNTRYRDINVGDGTVIAITTSGTLNTWGYGGLYALGNGNIANSNIPVTVNIVGETFVSASAHYIMAGAVTTTGKVYTWGTNSAGVMGLGLPNNVPVPVPTVVNGVISGVNIKEIATFDGPAYMMVLSEDGKVYTWGQNNRGNLGNGTTINSNVPIGPLSGLPVITQISAGGQSGALVL